MSEQSQAIKKALAGRRWDDIRRMCQLTGWSETAIIKDIIEKWFLLSIDGHEPIRAALDAIELCDDSIATVVVFGEPRADPMKAKDVFVPTGAKPGCPQCGRPILTFGEFQCVCGQRIKVEQRIR